MKPDPLRQESRPEVETALDRMDQMLQVIHGWLRGFLLWWGLPWNPETNNNTVDGRNPANQLIW